MKTWHRKNTRSIKNMIGYYVYETNRTDLSV